MDTPRPSARSAPTCSPPPTPATPNGSSASTPNQPLYPRPRGSTSHPTRTNHRPQRISDQPASKILTRAADPAVAGDSSTAQTWIYTYTADRLSSVCPPTSPTACTTYGYTGASQYPNTVLDLGAHT